MVVLNTTFELVVCSIAVSVVSVTVSMSDAFVWFRSAATKAHSVIGNAVSCPYCLSFYVAACSQYFHPLMPLDGNVVFSVITGWLCIVGIAAVFGGIMFYCLSRFKN